MSLHGCRVLGMNRQRITEMTQNEEVLVYEKMDE